MACHEIGKRRGHEEDAANQVLPTMRAQKSGKIINIASGTALSGSAGRIHYVASKAGVLGFTRTLAREVGDDNIQVNVLVPGTTLSEENPTEEILELRQRGVKSCPK